MAFVLRADMRVLALGQRSGCALTRRMQSKCSILNSPRTLDCGEGRCQIGAHAIFLRTFSASEMSALPNAKAIVERTFAELKLKKMEEQVGRVRLRQHVNPLKAVLMAPVIPPKWETVFEDASLPLTVDIGCGPGRFLMLQAKRNLGNGNFLGLDVREKLVDRSKVWAEELNLINTHFMTANATVSFDSLLSTYPGPLSLVSILCPDPHFKKRHQKRRIVKRSLVEAIVKHLGSGGRIFLQSDVKEVAVDMKQQFDEHIGVSLAAAGGESERDPEGWLLENPLNIPTEREIHALAKGERIYRLLYRRLSAANLC